MGEWRGGEEELDATELGNSSDLHASARQPDGCAQSCPAQPSTDAERFSDRDRALI